MNILFYLEPSIELGNPLFRYATLRNSLIPQIKTLQSADHKIAVLMSSPVAEKAVKDGYGRLIEHMVVVDPLEWVRGENVLGRSLRHHKGLITNEEVDHIKSMINGARPADFEPDLIIAWETSCEFLRTIYPNVRMLFQMPGFFSHPPFASMVSINNGLLDNSFVSDVHDKKNLEREISEIDKFRNHEKHFLRAVSPVRELIKRAREQFDRIILFPLQVDGYFMIDGVLGERGSQFEALVNVLSDLPKDIGLWVTNYKSRDAQSQVLSYETACYLESRFPNLIYYKETDDILYVSQFLVPDVDGVITISSSLGYQAAFWKKPLLTLGISHITTFATASSMADFISSIREGTEYSRDELIVASMRKQHVTEDFISSQAYTDWLVTFVRTGNLTQWNQEPIGIILMRNRRESKLLSQLGYFNNVRKESSLDHCAELSAQIIKHEVISFDIFDTLLYRPFQSPSDLFDLMSEEVRTITGIESFAFKTERQRAEREAFRIAIDRGDGEVRLAEIYEALQLQIGVGDDVRDQIMTLEMSLEKDLLYPRMSGYKAYQEAISLSKRIVIVSDMYLPRDFLASVLQKNGYEGYEDLFVSSDYRAKKHSGVLFEHLIAKLGINPNKILHVGDNLYADVKRAKEKGIKPFHLVKASEVFTGNDSYRVPWSRDGSRHALDWRMVLAILGNRMHDNPYIPHRKGTLFSGDSWKLGYYGFGPLLLGFAKWLLEQAMRDGVDRLYFLSRDGRIMKEAYDLLAPLYDRAPSSHYMLCSRRAVNLAKVSTLASAIDLLHVDFAHRTTLGHLLTHRFGASQQDIDLDVLKAHGYAWETPLTSDDLPRLRALIQDVIKSLLDIAANERSNYLDYLETTGIYADGSTAVVDIGYAGTMQESLYVLSGNTKRLGGYYLMTFRQALKRVDQRDLPIKGYLANFVDRHDTHHPFCRHVPLYETLFSSTDTSFLRMARDWNRDLMPVFMDRSVLEQGRVKLVRKVHNGALDFIKDATRILGPSMRPLDIEPNKSIRLLDCLFNNPHPRDAEMFSGVMFEDAYGGRQHKLILPKTDQLNRECVWRQGKEALERDQAIRAKGAPYPPQDLRKKAIYWLIAATLDERKKEKLKNKPEQFFHDSKNPIVKRLGTIYLKYHST